MEAMQYDEGVRTKGFSDGAAAVRGRTERLRDDHLKIDPAFSIDRLRIETRVMKETEGEPTVIRRAKIFAAVSREMPIQILPDELIIGHAGPRPLCRDIVPDDCPLLMEGRRFASVIETVAFGLNDFTPADLKALTEEIVPYWKGDGHWENSHNSRNIDALPDYLKELIFVDDTVFPPKRSMIYTPSFDAGHYGHNSIDYTEVLKKGLLEIKKEAETRLASLGNDRGDSRQFLEGVILCLDAAAKSGLRFASKARELAETENDEARKNE